MLVNVNLEPCLTNKIPDAKFIKQVILVQNTIEQNNIHADYRVFQKKCPIAILSLNLFQRFDYTFSHVPPNQNFDPVPSKHFEYTHPEYKLP